MTKRQHRLRDAVSSGPGNALEGAAPSAPVASDARRSIQQAPTERRPPGCVPSHEGRSRSPQRSALRAASLLLSLVLAAPLLAQPARPPVDVQATVEPRTTTIGTPLRYTLRISADAGVTLDVPRLVGAIGSFQVVDFGSDPPREDGGRTVIVQWYTLVTYETGDQVVPGPTIRFRRGAEGDLEHLAAPEALVDVRSLVDAAGPTPASEPRDIKGPVAVPRDYTLLVAIAAGVLLVLAALALLVRWVNRPRAAAVLPPRPPHELALEALARLHGGRLVEAGRTEEYYVRLSAIVREYVEARFGLRAPEMTSEEFLQGAQRTAQLTPPQRALLGEFLGEADLVKFARHRPSPADAERAYVAARDFVSSTAPEVPRAVA